MILLHGAKVINGFQNSKLTNRQLLGMEMVVDTPIDCLGCPR